MSFLVMRCNQDLEICLRSLNILVIVIEEVKPVAEEDNIADDWDAEPADDIADSWDVSDDEGTQKPGKHFNFSYDNVPLRLRVF